MLNNQILDTKKQIDHLADDVEQECVKLFDQIVQKANISESQNKKWSSKLFSKIKQNKSFQIKKILWQVFKWLFFAATIIFLVITLCFFFALNSCPWYWFLILGILTSITFFLFIFGHNDVKKLTSKIKENNIVINDLQIKIKKQLKPLIDYFNYQNIFPLISNKWKGINFHHCFSSRRQEQMIEVFKTLCNPNSRLNNINDEIDSLFPKKLYVMAFNKVWQSKKDVKLDKFKSSQDIENFSSKHTFDLSIQKYLHHYYVKYIQEHGGMINKFTANCSFYDLWSGNLYNHPFLFYNCLFQEWIIQDYVGSKTISNGKTTQTVIASFPWPKPVWEASGETFAFKSNVANNLSFLPTHCFRQLNEKIKIKNFINKNLPLENKAFDRAFSVKRNDEQGYRVLFTPLAQENFVNLLKETPFVMKKDQKITYVNLSKNNNQSLRFNSISSFNYDLNQFKMQLVNKVRDFVSKLCYCQLSIANIPAFCQEYDLNLKNDLNDNDNFPSEKEIETLVNKNKQFGLTGQTPTIINVEIISQTSIKKFYISIAKIYGSSFKMVNCIANVFTNGIRSIPTGFQGISVPVKYIDYVPHVKTCYAIAINLNCHCCDKIVNENIIIEHGVACCKFTHLPNKSDLNQAIRDIQKYLNFDKPNYR